VGGVGTLYGLYRARPVAARSPRIVHSMWERVRVGGISVGRALPVPEGA